MRRDEGRIVDPPLVFKRVFLGDERRDLDGENLGRALKKRDLDGGGQRLEWKERRDPLNAGGFGEPETMNASGVGGLESQVWRDLSFRTKD
ncbi:hypothetical protein TNCV_1670961 [Trichonephila clavipes]|nr:hypothetical protein TNCV_1670961 [Trichonephila clavipes]